MPPVDPDPQAIDHLEGNGRALRAYREAAAAEHESAQEETATNAG
jgi:hypothetical protein